MMDAKFKTTLVSVCDGKISIFSENIKHQFLFLGAWKGFMSFYVSGFSSIYPSYLQIIPLYNCGLFVVNDMLGPQKEMSGSS